MADPQGKNRLQEFKYKGKDQDVSKFYFTTFFNTIFSSNQNREK